jgi:hypothetical protein
MLAAKRWRLATGTVIFQIYYPATPLTVAYSTIFVTTGHDQHREPDDAPTAEAVKYGFGRLIDLASAESAAKHGVPSSW